MFTIIPRKQPASHTFQELLMGTSFLYRESLYVKGHSQFTEKTNLLYTFGTELITGTIHPSQYFTDSCYPVNATITITE